MDRSRRLKFAAATTPVQFVLSVVLAIVLSRLARGDAGEWADLVGVIVGMVLGPGVGAALMIFLVLRATSASTARALLMGLAAAGGAWVTTIVLFGMGVHPFAAIVIVFALSTGAVWVMSGRE
ncbi:MAG: hypothetical protein ACKOFT_06970 [Actinomycetota bacterium]